METNEQEYEAQHVNHRGDGLVTPEDYAEAFDETEGWVVVSVQTVIDQVSEAVDKHDSHLCFIWHEADRIDGSLDYAIRAIGTELLRLLAAPFDLLEEDWVGRSLRLVANEFEKGLGEG